MGDKKLKVLILEDNKTDADLIIQELKRNNFELEVLRAECKEDFLALLDEDLDLILSDYSLPQFNGIKALEILKEKKLKVPFILVSGVIGEEKAAEVIKLGADDYIMKDKIFRLCNAVSKTLEKYELRKEKELFLKALKESEERYKTVFQSVNDAIFLIKSERIVDCNEKTLNIFGCSKDQFLNTDPYQFLPQFQSFEQPSKLLFQKKLKLAEEGNPQFFEWKYLRYNKTPFDAEVSFNCLKLSGEVYVIAVIRDITLKNKYAAHYKAFADLGRRLSEATSPKEAGKIIIDIAERIIGWDACSFDLYEQSEDLFYPVINIDTIEGEKIEVPSTKNIHSPSARIRKVMDEGGQIFSRGDSINLVDDIVPFGDINKVSKSILIVPVRKKNIITGILSLHSYTSNYYDREKLNNLQHLSEHAAGALERIQAQKNLKFSEMKYKNIFEFAPVGIYQVTPKGKFIRANFALADMLGYEDVENLLVTDFASIVDLDEEQIANFNPAHPKEFFGNIEEKWKKKNGESIWVLLNVQTIKDPGGKILYYEGFVRDITDWKQTNTALQEAEKKYRSIFENSMHGILQAKFNGKIITANKALAEIIGYGSPLELMHKLSLSYHTFFANSEQKKILFKEIREHGKVEDFEIEIFRKDRKIIWLSLNALTIIDENGNPLYLEAILKDITKRKQAEKALIDSEAKYRLLFNSTPLPIIIFEIDSLNILNVNETAIIHYGYSFDEFTGMTIKELRPESGFQDLINYLSKPKRISFLENVKHLKKDGTEILVNINSYEIFLDKTKAKLEIINDVTEQMKTREKINMLAHAIKSISELVSISDINGNIIFVNDAFVQHYGFKYNEVIGKPTSIIRSKNNSSEVVKEIRPRTLAGGWQGELLNVRKDGTEFPVYLSTSVVRDGNGKPLYFVGVAVDISQRKRTINELIKAKEKAEEANRLKSGFLTTISHEIRTPLNSILGFSSVIKEIYYEGAEEQIKEFFNAVELSGERLLKTMMQILDIARIEANDFRISIKSIGLKQMFTESIKDFSKKIDEKNLELKLNFPCEEIYVRADNYCLNAVIKNILSNAIKYSERGSIRISLFEKDEIVECKIEDEGIGISEKYLDHLFETFSQEDVGIRRPYEGTGLGLALTKKYLHLIGGSINVESKKNIGTTVTFYLRKQIMQEKGVEA